MLSKRAAYIERNIAQYASYIERRRSQVPLEQTRSAQSDLRRRTLLLDDFKYILDAVALNVRIGLAIPDENLPDCYHDDDYWRLYYHDHPYIRIVRRQYGPCVYEVTYMRTQGSKRWIQLDVTAVNA
jgi:hypothetical protein